VILADWSVGANFYGAFASFDSPRNNEFQRTRNDGAAHVTAGGVASVYSILRRHSMRRKS
jgi:hypothetical protein